LLDVRERIRVDGRAIPPDAFVAHVDALARQAAPLAAQLPPDQYLSPVGLLLCVALLHFRAERVDVAVVEAGRGARFDDTRLVGHRVAAITPIMREHVAQLGPRLTRIAWHKAGAIPPRGAAVSAHQRPSVEAVLRAEADAQGSRLMLVGREVRVRRSALGGATIQTACRSYKDLRPELAGAHQLANLALAVGSVERLCPDLAELPADNLRQAVAATRWPGRADVLQERPLVLVDGAINSAAARAFLATARPRSHPPIVAIVGVPADKDYSGVLRTLAPHLRRLHLTPASNPHLRFPADALDVARRYRVAEAHSTLAEAVEAALAEVGPSGTVWIVGTQSLVADALRLWGRDLESL
jgi:dihydrofolate synthase/folylpolyglutamate synthase